MGPEGAVNMVFKKEIKATVRIRQKEGLEMIEEYRKPSPVLTALPKGGLSMKSSCRSRHGPN